MAEQLDPFSPVNLADCAIAIEILSEWDPDLAMRLQDAGDDPVPVFKAAILELKAAALSGDVRAGQLDLRMADNLEHPRKERVTLDAAAVWRRIRRRLNGDRDEDEATSFYARLIGDTAADIRLRADLEGLAVDYLEAVAARDSQLAELSPAELLAARAAGELRTANWTLPLISGEARARLAWFNAHPPPA